MKWKATPHLAQTFLRSHVALVSAVEIVVVPLLEHRVACGEEHNTDISELLFIDFYVWSRLFLIYVGYWEDELFSLSNEETDLEGLIEDSRGR